MLEYQILNPFETLIRQLTKWKRGNLIEVDPQKMRKLGLRPGDRISASEMAAISVVPMAII